MADHYYTPDPQSAHDEWQVRVDALNLRLNFTTDAGVFSRDGLDRGTAGQWRALTPGEISALKAQCGMNEED